MLTTTHPHVQAPHAHLRPEFLAALVRHAGWVASLLLAACMYLLAASHHRSTASPGLLHLDLDVHLAAADVGPEPVACTASNAPHATLAVVSWAYALWGATSAACLVALCSMMSDLLCLMPPPHAAAVGDGEHNTGGCKSIGSSLHDGAPAEDSIQRGAPSGEVVVLYCGIFGIMIANVANSVVDYMKVGDGHCTPRCLLCIV